MKLIPCLLITIFVFGRNVNGGDTESKGSEAAKLLVSKQVLNMIYSSALVQLDYFCVLHSFFKTDKTHLVFYFRFRTNI